MRVAVAGGGPGGLFFATLMRRADPSAEVTVFERNRGDDTFGFGVSLLRPHPRRDPPSRSGAAPGT